MEIFMRQITNLAFKVVDSGVPLHDLRLQWAKGITSKLEARERKRKLSVAMHPPALANCFYLHGGCHQKASVQQKYIEHVIWLMAPHFLGRCLIFYFLRKSKF
jgi:hypothetical protein